MTAANTYHSLNEHRLFTDAVYESGSSSKLISAAVVVAIFLGVGTYFYTSTSHDGVATTPASDASGDMNYAAPATDASAPIDTMQTAPAPEAAAPAPLAPDTYATPPVAPAQDTTLNRVPAASKPTPAPAQPVQRSNERAPVASKPEATAPIDRVAPAPADNGAVTPDMSMTAPEAAPAPSASGPANEAVADPVLTEYDVPTAAAPDATTEGSSGG